MKTLHERHISYICLMLIILFQFVNSGCTAKLPNIESFADATITLHKSVRDSGNIAVTELTRYCNKLKTKYPDLKSVETFKDTIEEFNKKWNDRTEFMAACVKYSDTLASIVSGARDTEKNANELVSSFNDTLSAIDLTGLSKGFSNLLKNLISQHVVDKAYRSLREAVLANDVNIQKIAKHLKIDFKDLNVLSNTLRREIISSVDYIYGSVIENREMLLEQRKDVRLELQKNWDEYKESKKDMKEGEKVVSWVSWWQEYLPILNSYMMVNREINNDLLFKEYNESKSKQLENVDLLVPLTKELARAVQVWAMTHAKLTKALKQKRRPDYRALLSIAFDIKSCVEEFRRKK